MIEIRRIGSERRHDLVVTLAAAFAEDPFIGWLLAESPFEPGEAQIRWWTGALAAMDQVAVFHATQDSSAVAVWVPPHDPAGERGDGENDFVAFVNEVCGAGAEERLGFFAELHAATPPEPHWHLTAVAVAPVLQNQGMGRKVMAPQIAQCDRLGRPAYLEATTSRSRLLYERLGFETLATIAPTGGPRLALMWREPR